MVSTRTSATFLAVIIAAASVVFSMTQRDRLRELAYEWNRPTLPSAQPRPMTPTATGTPRQTPTPRPSAADLPVEINLDVPFTSQAPFKVWDYDHEDFCEEASVLMAEAYMKGDATIEEPAVADQYLYEIKDWEIKTFGYFEDTTARQTARILTEKFGIADVSVVTDPTVTQLQKALAAGRVVLVPAAGRLLFNPNFTGSGPLYHMLVLKGYTTDGRFITNDPGTRLGADYLYTHEVIMNAMHDWNGGDVTNGAKVVIIVG